MNFETLNALRAVTAGDKYRTSRSTLRQRLIMTESLQSIILEIKKIHDEIAEVEDPSRPWSPENRHRVRGLAILGNSGAGKTHAAVTGIKLLPPVVIGALQVEPKVVSLRTPSSGTAGAFAKQIIVSSGLTITREPTDKESVGKVIGQMVRRKPTLLFADEVSRCANPLTLGPKTMLKESGLLWNIAISMLDETAWPTPLIFTGLPCLIDSLYVPDANDGTRRTRAEASRRFTKIRIPDATIENDGPAIENIVRKYAEQLGVKSTLSKRDEIGARLIHASGNAFGTALFIAQHAVALAHSRDGAKGKLKRDDFVASYHFLTGSPLDANIFAAGRWSEINPETVLPESFDDAKFRSDVDAK